MAIIEAKNLMVSFETRGSKSLAVRGASFEIEPGEALALVGESGCGKSALLSALMGLLPVNGAVEAGSIKFEGKELAWGISEKQWQQIRGGGIAMVMQDPMDSLNPVMKVGEQIAEAAFLHRGLSRKEAASEAVKALGEVGIESPEKRANQYPHQFSGGMRQRAAIAMAIASRPKALLCDEPTTALDVGVQAQILEIIKKMQKSYGLALLLVTHDLGVAAMAADRIAVMYAGDIVEVGTAREIFRKPAHPYTWALLSSMPQLARKGERLYTAFGTPPDLSRPITGDAFAPRNPYALKIDYEKKPPFFALSNTHKARTWLLDSRAPKADPPDAIKRLMRIDK